MSGRVREERRRRGLTQHQLADQAGVSRQLVAAVESGRHAPGVEAALGIAAALGTSVEALFGATPGQPPDALPVIEGASDDGPQTIGRVGGRLVHAPLPGGAVGSESWAVPDARLANGQLEVLPGGLPASEGLVLAGCDPALGLAVSLLSRSTPHRAVAVHASTEAAVRALGTGRVHGAVVHGPPRSRRQPPIPVWRWRLARWQVGLAGPAGRPPSLDELCTRALPVAQREVGASSQRALERALRAAGAGGAPAGPVAVGHLDAARHVAHGFAAGLTIESAARALGLSFVPIEEHAVELWVDRAWSDHPAAVALLEVVAGAAFSRRLGMLGGYDLAECGTEVGTA